MCTPLLGLRLEGKRWDAAGVKKPALGGLWWAAGCTLLRGLGQWIEAGLCQATFSANMSSSAVRSEPDSARSNRIGSA